MSLYSDLNEVLTPYANKIKGLAASDNQIKADLADVPNYPVKSAEQLISDKRTVDKVPYKYRASASGKSDRAYDMIVGGTVGFNQLVRNGNFADASVWISSNGVEFTVSNNIASLSIAATEVQGLKRIGQSINFIEGHKLFISFGYAGSLADKDIVFYAGSSSRVLSTIHLVSAMSWAQYCGIVNTKMTEYATFVIGSNGAQPDSWTINLRNIMLFDLTAMFGTTIAEHIYSLEQSQAGAGVALFRQMFPNEYYPYNAGELISVAGLSAKEVVGFNLWDEEWENGVIANSNGQNNSYEASTRIRSKNYIPVMPNTQYYCKTGTNINAYFYDANKVYIGNGSQLSPQIPINNVVFTTPSNCHFMRFAQIENYDGLYHHNICINLSDPLKNGTYEPYHKTVYPLDNTLTLRGVPVLKDDKVEFDGDTYEADGTVTRRYGVVDLGTLNWSYNATYQIFYSADIDKLVKSNGKCICDRYACGNASNSSADNVVQIGRVEFFNEDVIIKDTAYTDAATFKTAMSGVYLVYERATPTTEEATPYTNPQVVDGYGTEEYVSTSICPVGHITEYPDNLRAKIDGLPWDLSMIAPVETAYTATRNYTVGNLLIVDNTLYKVTANIANNGTITPNSNVTATTLSEVISALA